MDVGTGNPSRIRDRSLLEAEPLVPPFPLFFLPIEQGRYIPILVMEWHYDKIPFFRFDYGKVIVHILDVYDGDTVTVGFIYGSSPVKVKVRLAHIDTPELKGGNAKEKAKEAKRYLIFLLTGKEVPLDISRAELRDILSQSQEIVEMEQLGFDKYGRVLANIFRNGTDISQEMLGAGHAVPYEGGKKERED